MKGRDMPPPPLIIPGSAPIVGNTVFAVCKNGHVVDAAQHPMTAFKSGNAGQVETAILCARCQFDFFANMFGAVILPRETTRREAEWKARAMHKGALRQAGLQCCDLEAMHLGECEIKAPPPEEPAS